MQVRQMKVVLPLLVLIGAGQPASAQDIVPLAGVDTVIEAGLKTWQVPGLALAVVRDGRVILARGYGVRSLQTREPVNPDTLFYIGSATKSFTATLVAMTVEEGKADWDRPLAQTAPGFRVADPLASQMISFRDLLSHRTGIPRQEFLKVNAPDRRTDLIERIRFFEPTLDFRSGFQYCNETVTVAGDLLARTVGATWEDMVRQRIFEPLGMTRSTTSVAGMKHLGNHAAPYIVRRTDPEEMALYDVGELRGPAGAVISSANDLSRWVLFNLAAGKSNERTLIGAAALAQLWVPRIPATRIAPRYPELSHQSYGLGWFVDSYRGSLRISHPGNLYGFTSVVSFLPREQIGVVVLANLNGTPLPHVVERLVYDALLKAAPVDWTNRFQDEEAARRPAQPTGQQVQVDPGRQPDTRPSRALGAFAGTYRSPAYGTLNIRQEGDGLVVRVHSGEFPLRHYNYDVFEFYHPVEDQSWLLAFRGSSAGKIETLAIDGGPGSKEITFTRMPPEVADHPLVETRDQAPQVDAAAVVTRCAEAMGGTDRIKALRTLRMEYTPSDGGPAISVEVRRPNLLRKEIRATALILSDGIRASVQRLAPTEQPPRIEPAEKLQDFEMDIARFLPAFFDHPPKYLGLGESGGIRCHVLEVVLPLGPHVTYFIDTATNLVRTVSVELLVGGKPFRPADWTWSDYRPVQGLMYPSTFIVTAADGSVSLRRVKSIEINPPLDESRFRVPTDAR